MGVKVPCNLQKGKVYKKIKNNTQCYNVLIVDNCYFLYLKKSTRMEEMYLLIFY